MPEPVIVVHGGAGAYEVITQHKGYSKESYEAGTQTAARIGWRCLQDGKSAVDAVQAAVMSMEADPTFNTGRGSCLTSAGQIEQEGSIMDGQTMNVGGVIGLSTFPHPIAIARDVMDKSAHVLFAGQGAVEFALDHGHKQCSMEELVTERSRNRLQKWLAQQQEEKDETKDDRDKTTSKSDPPSSGHDTVGAVALDCQGNVAYANSTGGLTGKQPGRVGDSPLVGCGGYADNAIGAMCTTGKGEAFVRIAASKHMACLIQTGLSAQLAVEQSLQYMLERVGGRGGAIAVTSDGGVGVAFNTDGMAWATVQDGQLKYGVFPGESTTLDVN